MNQINRLNYLFLFDAHSTIKHYRTYVTVRNLFQYFSFLFKHNINNFDHKSIQQRLVPLELARSTDERRIPKFHLINNA